MEIVTTLERAGALAEIGDFLPDGSALSDFQTAIALKTGIEPDKLDYMVASDYLCQRLALAESTQRSDNVSDSATETLSISSQSANLIFSYIRAHAKAIASTTPQNKEIHSLTYNELMEVFFFNTFCFVPISDSETVSRQELSPVEVFQAQLQQLATVPHSFGLVRFMEILKSYPAKNFKAEFVWAISQFTQRPELMFKGSVVVNRVIHFFEILPNSALRVSNRKGKAAHDGAAAVDGLCKTPNPLTSSMQFTNRFKHYAVIDCKIASYSERTSIEMPDVPSITAGRQIKFSKRGLSK